MRWAMAGLGTIIVGILTFMGIYYVLDGTIVNEEDYHGLKEAMSGAMYDSIDIDYYQKTGEIKIIKEKFVETFTRRFTETTTYGKKGYTIEFYDIIESPPKASIIIKGHSGDFQLTLDSNDISSYDIINKLDGIILYNAKHLYTYDLYSFTTYKSYRNNHALLGIDSKKIKIPQELNKVYNINEDKNHITRDICKIKKIEYIDSIAGNDMQAYEDFKNNKDNWYYESTITTQNLPDNPTICEIETISNFTYNDSTGILNKIPVTFKDNCMKKNENIVGYKYRVIWECSQK